MMEKEKKVKSFYDKISVSYESHNNRVCDRILEHFILVSLPQGKKLRILDAGGGTGRFSATLLKKGHDITLSELSEGMLNKAKHNLVSFHGVQFVIESVVDMKNQKKNSFDIVLMMNGVLDYCGDHNKAISETYRVLKKGGLFLGNVNNRIIYCKNHELKEEKYRLFEENMKNGNRHITWGGLKKGHISHEFTLGEFKKSLTDGAFKVIKIFGVFNLFDKYEMDKIRDKKGFINLQIKYAEYEEYIHNSSDFFFVAEKPK